MKCTGYTMKNCNEMHWVYNEKLQWNALGVMKNRNEMHWVCNEKSQWNAQGM